MSQQFRLFRIASREIPTSHYDRAGLIDALRATLVDPKAPSFDLQESQLVRLEQEIARLDVGDWRSREEALFVAVAHAREVMGWNPFQSSRLNPWLGADHYLHLRNAIAVLCLAAQIASGTDPLILTVDTLRPMLASR